jgi:hypothetical protein
VGAEKGAAVEAARHSTFRVVVAAVTRGRARAHGRCTRAASAAGTRAGTTPRREACWDRAERRHAKDAPERLDGLGRQPMSAEKSSPVSVASVAPQERLGELLGRIGAEGLHELEDLARPLSAESLHHVGGQVVDRRRGARGRCAGRC